MRKLIVILLFVNGIVNSQVLITDKVNQTNPLDQSALLDLDMKLGFLPPVMTEDQRNLISVNQDSKGLIIYSLTTKSINIYDGTNWHVIKPQYKSVGTSSVCPNENNYRELLNCIQTNYKVQNSLGYTDARDILYGEIDLDANNQLEGIYTGFKIDMDYSTSTDPSTEAYNKGINAEHLFPQSMGAKKEPARSDMYHLYPAKDNVNSSRSNCPHNDVIDTNTDKWYINDTSLTQIPTSNINAYSEKYNGAIYPTLEATQQCAFEPRESVKGNVARAVFYFYAMYNKENSNVYEMYANDEFFKVMRNSLIDWDLQDPIDVDEIDRAIKIEAYQGNTNPFIQDPELGQRLFK